jgi:hypothetical protein
MSKVYPLAKLQKRVEGDNVTDVWRIQVNAYGKRAKESGWEVWVALNEFVCATLGTLIGLPIPPFAMLEKRNASGRESLWFSSLSYTKEGENLPAINPAVVYSELPDICAGVIVFDLWIANMDRHDKNLSFDPNVVPKRLNVFDHSHALFGLDGVSRLTRLADKFTLTATAESRSCRNCLMDYLSDFLLLENWIKRITALPLFQLSDTCRHAEELGLINDSERRLLLEFLIRRRKILRELLYDNRAEFPAMISDLLS